MVLSYEITAGHTCEFDAAKEPDVFYRGVLHSKNGEAEVFNREVSIFSVCNMKRFNTMAACADRMRKDSEPHTRVCPIVFQDLCDKITVDGLVPVVAVDRFDGFVDDIGVLSEDVGCPSQKLYEHFAKVLRNPRNDPKHIPRNDEIPKDFVPGCPNFLIGSEVRALLIELGNMVKCGVFPSNLNKLSSYVVKAGKIYFLKVDLLKTDHSDVEWNEIIRQGISQFGALVRFLLSGCVENWTERTCILDCFNPDHPYHMDHLFMICTHPLWMGDVFQILSKLVDTYVKKDPFCERGHEPIFRNRTLFNIKNLRRGLNTKQIRRKIFPKESSWYDDKTATIRIALFVRASKQHPVAKDNDKILYDTSNVDDFHKFSRDWVLKSFYHPFTTYGEIMLNWPYLFHVFHQLLCGFLDSEELVAEDRREEEEALKANRKMAQELEDEDRREREAFLKSLRRRVKSFDN